MGNSYYGRRRNAPMTAMPMPCARRTANDGVCPACDTATDDRLCDEMVLAMSYVLLQEWGNLYAVEDGFDRGTIFAELDKPFVGGGVRCGM